MSASAPYIKKFTTFLATRRPGAKKNILHMILVTAGLAGARLLGLLISVLIARISGVETFGEFTLFISIFLIVESIPQQIDQTFILLANKHNANFSPDDYFATAIFAKTCYIVLIAVLYFLLGDYFSDLVFKEKNASIIMGFAMASGSIACLFLSSIAYYQRQKEFIRVAIRKPTLNTSLLLIFGLLLLTNKSLEIDLIMRVYLCVSLLLAMYVFIKHRFAIRSGMKNVWNALPEFSRLCLIFLGAIAITMISRRLDVFFLASLMDYEAVGLYGAALRVAVVASIMTGAITTLLMPGASAAYKNKKQFNNYLKKAAFLCSLQTFVSAFLLLASPFLLRFMMGGEYMEIETVAKLLIIQTVFIAFSLPLKMLIQASAIPSLTIIMAILRLMISVGFLTVLVPKYALLGAGIAAMSTALVMAFVMLLVVFLFCKSRSLGATE